jgi:hypothetical protein
MPPNTQTSQGETDMVNIKQVERFAVSNKENKAFVSAFKNGNRSSLESDKWISVYFGDIAPDSWERAIIELVCRFYFSGAGSFENGKRLGQCMNSYSKLTSSTVDVFDRICKSEDRIRLIKRIGQMAYVFSETTIDLKSLINNVRWWEDDTKRSVYYGWMRDFPKAIKKRD